MVPRVAKRAYSFQVSKNYYLSNKDHQAEDPYRVEFVKTYNLPTDDPHKAFDYMAYTAMNADELKAYSAYIKDKELSKAGRKSSDLVVYAYSLAWDPSETPTKEEMIKAGEDTMGRLNLSEHECVMVAHNDTKHPHIHCIVNLVNPETGYKKNPHNDKLTLSDWALEYEKQRGEIYCEKRVEEVSKRQRNNVKKDVIKERLMEHYLSTQTGAELKQSLENDGFILGNSRNKRGGVSRPFLITDNEGDIYNLARMIPDVKTKQLRERFSDVDISQFPSAQDIANERKGRAVEKDKDKATAQYQFGRKAQQAYQEELDIKRDFQEQSLRKKHGLVLYDKKKNSLTARFNEATNVQSKDAIRKELVEWEGRFGSNLDAFTKDRDDILREQSTLIKEFKASVPQLYEQHQRLVDRAVPNTHHSTNDNIRQRDDDYTQDR